MYKSNLRDGNIFREVSRGCRYLAKRRRQAGKEEGEGSGGMKTKKTKQPPGTGRIMPDESHRMIPRWSLQWRRQMPHAGRILNYRLLCSNYPLLLLLPVGRRGGSGVVITPRSACRAGVAAGGSRLVAVTAAVRAGDDARGPGDKKMMIGAEEAHGGCGDQGRGWGGFEECGTAPCRPASG